MNELPSAEFRRRYARLAEPTLVTVNGHPIGIWTPAGSEIATHTEPADQSEVSQPAKSAQAARDELLRKINRSK